MSHLPRLVLFALLTVYIVWGSTYFAISIALNDFPPYWLMGSRFLVAAGLLFAWQIWRGQALPNRREWMAAVVIGTLMIGGGMGFTAVAQQSVSSGITAVFIACSPMVLTCLTGITGTWPKLRDWGAILLGFFGAVLLASGNQFSAQTWGLLALFAAIFCWDVGSILSIKKFQLAQGGMGFASEMLCGGIVLCLIALFKGEAWPQSVAWSSWAAWWYLVIAGSLLAFTAYMYLLSKVSPGLAGSYAYVNPVIALIIGAMLGNERLTQLEWIASGVILVSVVWLLRGHSQAKQA